MTHLMTPKTPDILNTILSLFSQEKTDMARRLQMKKDKVKELKLRKGEVEGFLTEKEKIARMEEEASKMQSELDVGRRN